MSAPDQIVRAILDDRATRVVAALTTGVSREAARRQGAVGGPAAALGRAATAGLLLATLTKDEERVTLQIAGDGPLGPLTVDAHATGAVRAFAKHPDAAVPAVAGARVPLGRAVGSAGLLAVVRDLGLKEHFSGQTALVDGEIDTDVESYLTTSEQIDSALGCEALLGDDLDVRVAGGILVQALPGSDAAPLLAALRDALRGGALARLLRTEPPPADAEALARAVLGPAAASLRVLDTRPVRFHCPCSRARAAGALRLVAPADLPGLLEEDGGASVRCEFCREVYRFAADEVTALRSSVD